MTSLRTLVLACTAALAVLAGPAAAADPLTGNLVVNPGGEATTKDSAGVVRPDGWIISDSFTVLDYTNPDSPPAPSGAGARYFAGGYGATTTTAMQVVDLSAQAQAIDGQPRTQVHLSALLGGFDGQDDVMDLRVALLDSSGGELATTTLGPVKSAQRGGATKLVPLTKTLTVPTGTRQARVVLTATRVAGDFNDGYGDNIDLRLFTKDPPRGGGGGSAGLTPVVPDPKVAKIDPDPTKASTGGTTANLPNTVGLNPKVKFVPVRVFARVPPRGIVITVLQRNRIVSYFRFRLLTRRKVLRVPRGSLRPGFALITYRVFRSRPGVQPVGRLIKQKFIAVDDS
jgi:hypothetical protein